MKRLEMLFGVARVPLDALAVAAALLLSYALRVRAIDLVPGLQLLEPATTLPSFDAYLHGFVFWGVALFFVIAAFLGLYSLMSTGSAWSEFGRVGIGALLWIAMVIAWYFLIQKQLFYSRILLLHSTVFLAIFVLTERTGLIVFQRFLLRRGFGVRSVLTVGAHHATAAALATLERDVHYEYRGHKHSLLDVQEWCRHHPLDLVIQTDANPSSEQTAGLIDFCRSHHVQYAYLPPLFTDVPHLLRIGRLGLLPLLQFTPTPLDGWGRVWKAFFDSIASAVLLLILSPILLCIAFGILLESGLPIFYISKRVGERGQGMIPVIKFRSMVKDADAQKHLLHQQNHRSDGPLFKMHNDPRVTRFGKFLRRFSLDELPQLFNVLVGHMALVGPRPHLFDEVSNYSSYERRVFAIRPGMTGLAQVSGRSDLSFADEVRLDLQYIEEWSPLLDLWILWRTVIVVMQRHGAD